jgi:predicted nuclease with RNAse H fold
LIAGIDYGAKLAGTTAICYGDSTDSLQVYLAEKKQDADQFLLDFFSNHQVKIIGIDAPLSLPSGVLDQNGDYFYRNCDKVLGAMSPMFIGGLTARAMKLKYEIETKYGCEIREVYPKAVVNHVLDECIRIQYRKNETSTIEDFNHLLKNTYNLKANPTPSNWHQIDAILAWYSAYRYSTSQHLSFGDKYGHIIV